MEQNEFNEAKVILEHISKLEEKIERDKIVVEKNKGVSSFDSTCRAHIVISRIEINSLLDKRIRKNENLLIKFNNDFKRL